MNNMNIVRIQEIIIGENVWLSFWVIILLEIHIGRNSVIGAGCEDIPPNVFASGFRAKLLYKVERALHNN
jgi:acetyltransferase-like isoleucine patch superfamily enzyme